MKQQFLDLKGLTELVSYLKDSIANKKVILPYASNTLFPSVGDINSVYIDTATNSIYRWDSTNKKYEMLAKAVKSVSISESTENGKITLTVDGVKTTVPIHGLKSAAYTESSAYATAAQGVKAENAVQSISLASGTNNGTVKLTVDGKATDNIAVKGLGSAAYTASSAYATAGHTHTKAQIGLGNVDNTADKDKSVKHATTADSATSAGTATTATNVSGQNAYTDDARHVWFSVKGTETQRAYNDNFTYNPVKNLLTTNITGSAASASSVPWTGVTGKPSTFTPSAHNHDDSTITSLNASKLFGTIDIARLPHGALERCVIVEDDTARFKLTTANIQLGDTVKVDKTKTMYFVINESKLNSEEGYTVYTAGTATSVPWSGVTGKPSTFTPSSHTHPYLSALSVSGRTITYTKGDGTTGTITTQDTWRGIQNNLTSDSTTDSLAAAQGKVLKGLVDGKLPLSGGVMTGTAMISWPDSGNWNKNNANVTFPVTRGGLSWSGQSDGIQLYAVETGNDNLELYLKFSDDNSNGLSIRNKDNAQTARISATGIITASSFVGNLNGTASAAPWSGITGKPTTYPPSSHTHNYAGSSSSGGIAWNANALYVNPSTRQASANYDLTNNNTYAYRVTYSIASSSTTTGKPPSDAHILTFGWDSNAGWGAQLAIGNSKNNHLYLRGSASVTANNKASSSWEDWRTVLDSSNYNSYAPTKTGTGASGTWGISVTGNAGTATKLATARSINGTNFDGSGNITTATWGTARNITIGSTKKSVNGGADVSWSLSEIGAAAASHTHSYLPLAGGVMTGNISYKGTKATCEMIKFIDNTADVNGNGIAIGGGGLTIVGGGESSDYVKSAAGSGGNERLVLANDDVIEFYTGCQDGLSKATHTTIDNTGLFSGTAAKANSVPWSGVSGKPGTFTPSSHSHSYIAAVISSSAVPAKAADGRVEFYYNVNNGLANNMPSSNNANAIISLSRHAGDYPSQLGFSSDGNIYYREGVGTTAWKTILTSSNYTSYTVTKTGGGASGTWSINVTGSAGSVAWGNVSGKPSTFAPSSHTHNYAGSGSAGGSANSAVKLDTTTAGSATQPVYFSGGKPVACSYTINASVPSGAKFTDTNTWRGVQNNLTSTATDQSLAAAQGKVLNEKKMGAVSANGYYGMARPDNNTSDWIRTTTNGLLPVQSGSRGSGHSSLGTNSWYFNQAYVDHVYSTDVKIADKVTLQYDSTNACLNFVFS